MIAQDHGLEAALDVKLIEHAKPAIENGTPVEFVLPIRNVDRTVSAMLSRRDLAELSQIEESGARQHPFSLHQ